MDPTNGQPPAPAQQAPAQATQSAAVEAPKPDAQQAPQKPAARPFVRKPAPVVEAAPKTEPTPEASKPDTKRTQIGTSALSKLRSQLEVAKANAAETESLRAELAEYAKQTLATAPEKARKYIETKHKGDPRAQLQALRELRDAGLLDEPKRSPVEGEPANTAPPKAPAADATDPDVQLAQQYQQLSANPALFLVADQFRQKHGAAIKRGLAKLPAKN